MKVSRALLVVVCMLAICLPGGGSALAQEQAPKPDSAESKEKKESREKAKGTEDEKDIPFPIPDVTERITVTATRVETELMKTPIAISVFDQEELDRQGVQSVADIAQMVPNMDIAIKNGQSTPIISMRGVRSTNETELGDPSVGVHMDGIYSPRMQGILALMFDNERVEVLRGPQGTLFGRNSTVGSINIVSAKPKLDGFDSKISLSYGNYNSPEVSGMVNYPVSDTFGLRFAGRMHKSDSYLDGYWDPNQYDQRFVGDLVAGAPSIAPGSFEDCTSPDCMSRTQHSNWWIDTVQPEGGVRALVPAGDEDFYGNSEEWAYRFSGLWQPRNKDMSLNFSFQHYRSDSAGGIDQVNCDKLRGRPTYNLDYDSTGRRQPEINGVNDCSTLFPKDDTYQAVVNVPGRLYLDIKYLRSNFTWDLSKNLRLVYLGGFEDQDRESAQDMEQSLNAWDQAMFFLPGTGSKSWSQELQLQSYGDKRFNWIAGANYFFERTSTFGFFDNSIDEKALWDQPDRSTTASALFAQGTYSMSDRWHLTLGGRYSDETREDKGGRSYICNVSNGCASATIPDSLVNTGLRGFDREVLSGLPTDFFANPSVYTDDNGTPEDPSDDFQVFNANDNKGSWTNDDWRLGVDFQKDDNTLWYGYLATGFKAGGIGDVFEGTVIDGGLDEDGGPIILGEEDVVIRTEYNPEKVTTLELGFKQRLFDGKLDLKGAYFFSDYENMQYASVGSFAVTEKWGQLLDLNGDPFLDENDRPLFGWIRVPLIVAYFTQNVPGAQIQGLELEYDWRPWKAGRIYGYASWLDTEITEDWVTKWDYDAVSYFGIDFAQSVDAENDLLQVNLKGNELAVSPPFKVHLTADHAFLLPKRKISIVPWVTAHWEDDSYLTVWNVDKHMDDLDFVILPQDIKYTDDKREAWSMFHAGVRLYSGAATMELYAYNITDEVIQWWGGASEQVPKGSMSMPRTYGFRFGYQF